MRWVAGSSWRCQPLQLLNATPKPHISLLFSDLATGLRSTNALNINFFLLPTKFLQPVNLAITIWSLFNPLAVPAPHRLSAFLAHQPSRHWKSQIAHSDMHHPVSGINSLIHSFRQPRQSCLDSPPHSLVSSSLLSSPLSSSITPSLFHSRLKTYIFNKSSEIVET